jgi:hypothetical protein
MLRSKLFLLPCLLLTGLLTMAAAPPPHDDTPQVTVNEQGNIYVVEGSYSAPVSLNVGWDVLTDFAALPRFVSVVKRSEPLRHEGPRLLLRQDGVQTVLGFTKEFHLLLDVYEQPKQSVFFRNLDGRDFAVYSGVWRIWRTPEGVEVRYSLRVRPQGDPPDIFVKPILHDGVVSALTALRNEMLRRASSRADAAHLPP